MNLFLSPPLKTIRLKEVYSFESLGDRGLELCMRTLLLTPLVTHPSIPIMMDV